MSNIEMGKEYKTRDGREVAQLVRFNGTKEPQAWFGVAGGEVFEWGDDGRYHCDPSREDANDLIECKPRIKRDVRLNVYADGTVVANETLDEALGNQHKTLHAVKHISIDCEQGEGL